MKYIKVFGLALVAAFALTAFVGAGTASAVLCKANESPCPAGNQYPLPTTVLISSPEVTFVGFVSIKCALHETLVHEKSKMEN